MKKDLLSKWLALKGKQKSTKSELKVTKYPLAYNQQSLYFLYQLYPDNPFYNYQDYYHFRGDLNVEKLIEAFKIIIDRHPVFRTHIVNEQEELVQIVSEHGELEIFRHELKSQSEEDAKALIILDANRLFDLSQKRQLRLSIVKYDDRGYAIGVSAHHIMVDKWSIGMLRTEVAELYQQLSKNHKPVSQPIKYTFGQYAYEQVRKSIDEDLVNYWVKKLGNENEPINLPCDYLRPEQSTFKGKHFKVSLENRLSEALKQQCKDLKVTPFVYLFSVFNILLYKYTGKNSFNIGVPFSNKQNAELEPIIGFFDETVIFPTKITDKKFAEFIDGIANDIYDVFEKKQIPIELLVKELNPDRTSGINPLFQVMFIYHKKTRDPSFGNDLQFSSETLDTGVSKFDLSMFAGEDEDGFSLTFEYATDLFKQDTIALFSNHFINLLNQVINEPGICLSQLSLLGKSDLDRIVLGWNNTFFEIDSNATVLDEISKQVTLSADKIAVADPDRRLTYGELDQASNMLSHYLSSKKVKHGDIVGLYLDRSVNMIVAILGVLKSGAGYLPLDPEYPENRITHMINDAKVSHIISSQSIDGHHSAKVHDINEILNGKQLLAESIKVEPAYNAYVIYTSGSTGTPKGVAVSHANLYNSTMARRQYYQNSPGSFLLFSSFSFDSSIAGIFWTLSSGGKLVIAAHRLEQDMDRLGMVIKQEEVTHTLLLPGLYKEIIQSVSKSSLHSLKNVILAGEAIEADVPKHHFNHLNNVRLFNEYGPTEATVWATVEELSELQTGPITIGKPIGNTQIFILDSDLQPLPVGIPGEIFIGGLNITNGYLHHPKATREKFIKSPFEHFPGMLYKTGDLAKFTNEGKIDFLGRKDGQVKIRGHRIELHEIESKINKLEEIKDNIVIIHGDQTHNKRLLCYYIGEKYVESNEFRSFLKNELPDFMIPNQFISIDEFPKLPNGKIDRKKLPKSSIEEKLQVENPVTEEEKKLAEIWKDVLNLDQISINDNFFEIGGDSISSIRIISKAKNSKFKIEPDQIFKYQTIKELARHISIDKGKNGYIGLLPMIPYHREMLVPKAKAGHSSYAFFLLTFKSPFSKNSLSATIDKLLKMHDALTIFLDDGLAEGKLNFHKLEKVNDFSNLPDLNKVKEQFIYEKLAKLGNPAFKVFDIGQEDNSTMQSVLLAGHKAICDLHSWKIIITAFLEEINGDYKQDDDHSTTNHFSEWIQLVNADTFSGKIEGDLSFWNTDLIASNNETATITESRIPKPEKPIEQKELTLILPEGINSAFNTSTEELLIAAYINTLSGLFDGDSSTIWLEKDGRADQAFDKDFSETVGCFKTRFPIVLKTNDEIKNVIINTKETLRAVPNFGYGYGQLVDQQKLASVPKEDGFGFIFIDLDKEGYIIGNEFVEVTPFHFKTEHVSTEYKLELSCTKKADRLVCRLIMKADQGIEIENVSEVLQNNFQKIANFCLQSDKHLSPSDFPDADLSGDDLDEILKQL